MTIELGVFDIVLYTLLLCTGTILCYMLPHSVSFRRKSYEAMALDLLEQGKIKDAADIMDCLHWWHFTKETSNGLEPCNGIEMTRLSVPFSHNITSAILPLTSTRRL